MRRRILFLLSATTIGAACQSDDVAANRVTLGEPDEAYQGSGLPAEIQGHIDQGNAAYRARDYEAALRHYQQAADVDPAQPTAWFGVAMAASALGNEELAESARRQVEQLDPQLGTAPHQMPADPPHPMPADPPHPMPATPPHP